MKETSSRIHADLISKWASDDSLVIEMFSEDNQQWIFTANPMWHPEMRYRIKPTRCEAHVSYLKYSERMCATEVSEAFPANVMLSFDHNGNLIDAEIIR